MVVSLRVREKCDTTLYQKLWRIWRASVFREVLGVYKKEVGSKAVILREVNLIISQLVL